MIWKPKEFLFWTGSFAKGTGGRDFFIHVSREGGWFCREIAPDLPDLATCFDVLPFATGESAAREACEVRNRQRAGGVVEGDSEVEIFCKKTRKGVATETKKLYIAESSTGGALPSAEPANQLWTGPAVAEPPASEANPKESHTMATATATVAPAKGKKATKAASEKAPKEPKEQPPRLSATDEEIEAAVAGTLKPRDNASEIFDKDKLVQRDDKGTPRGRPTGKTTGLPILLAWCYVFQQNEKAPKAKKLTDEGISKWMHSEFPGRNTPAFDSPNPRRIGYNRGDFTQGKVPKVQSRRYDENGDVFERKPSTKEEKAEKAKKRSEIKVVEE